MLYFWLCLIWALYAVYQDRKSFPRTLLVDSVFTFIANFILMPLMVTIWLIVKIR